MKVKERLDEPTNMGYPSDGRYQNGLPSRLNWDSVQFPTAYRLGKPVGVVRPPLSEYFCYALSKTTHRFVPPYWAGVSRIEYDCSVNKQKMNYCYHNSNLMVNLPISFKMGLHNDPTYIAVQPLFRYGMRGTPRSPLYFLGDADRRARSNRAYWTMQPKFEGHIDATNFLLELKDFKGLLNQLRRLVNGHFPKFRKSVKRTSGSSSLSGAVGEVTESLSSAWLAFTLQWEPLLSDIASIGENLMNQVEAAQNKFRADGDHGLTRHYSEDVNKIDERTSGSKNDADIFYGGRFRTTRFTATMCMKFDYDMRTPMAAFLKYWKLGGSFSTIWNATRLSFVIDYFLKIGKAISAMEIDENVKNVRTLKYCESYKSEDSSGLFFNASGTSRLHESLISGEPFAGFKLISGYQARFYIRMPCSPSKGLYIPLMDTPNSKQGVTMIALTRSMLG